MVSLYSLRLDFSGEVVVSDSSDKVVTLTVAGSDLVSMLERLPYALCNGRVSTVRVDFVDGTSIELTPR